tara:strand:- start:534 stop:758 length:225 start_codon:yes stop_codon:yes gene_type:complete
VVPGVDIVHMKKITELNNKLKDLEKEIANYQKTCNHREKSLKAQKNSDIRFICKDCFMVLGWPTPAELKDWLKR